MKSMLTVFLIMLLLSNFSFAQETNPYFVTATKMHWNMDMENFSMDEWKAVEREYLDKVVKKNPLIKGQLYLMHYFTADNTELILVTTYESWSDIEKAAEKTQELIKAAWPNEKDRRAFFTKRAKYYAKEHSDEIYATLPVQKTPKANFDKDMVYYVRVSHFAFPENGTDKEFDELSKQFFDAVINKNDLIKAYYPNEHAWGSDKTQFTEVFVVESLADLESALKKNGELYNANWNDDDKRKAFNEKMNKYTTGVHGDYVYRSVHELTK